MTINNPLLYNLVHGLNCLSDEYPLISNSIVNLSIAQLLKVNKFSVFRHSSFMKRYLFGAFCIAPAFVYMSVDVIASATGATDNKIFFTNGDKSTTINNNLKLKIVWFGVGLLASFL